MMSRVFVEVLIINKLIGCAAKINNLYLYKNEVVAGYV